MRPRHAPNLSPPPPLPPAAFALGVNISIARIGSVVNDIASPALYNAFGKSVPLTLYFGVGICLTSTLAAMCVVPLDKKAEATLVKHGHKSKKTGVDAEEQVRVAVSTPCCAVLCLVSWTGGGGCSQRRRL